MLIKEKGFSLIELMVVVVVLGILASISYPAYMKYVDRSKVSDAKALALETVHVLERHHARQGTYVGATIIPNRNGHSQAVTSAVNTFTLTVTVDVNSDLTCQTLTINQSGQKTPASCWD